MPHIRRPLRRSQAVVPFGVGAIVDFEGEALMAAGIHAWSDMPPEDLFDARFAKRLGVRKFRQPPPAPSWENPDRGAPLPFVRFPRWHFCPRCRRLRDVPNFVHMPPQCDSELSSPALKKTTMPCSKLPARKRYRMVPLRFIVACRAGHIEDFPWEAWAHTAEGEPLDRKNVCTKKPAMFFYATKKGGLAGLRAKCHECGASRSMLGAVGPGALRGFRCNGRKPWLGWNAYERCEAKEADGSPAPPQVLQRGASNVYFANTLSSLLIPPFSTKVRQLIDDPVTWDNLVATDGPNIREQMARFLAQNKRLDPDEVVAAMNNKLEAPDENEDDDEIAYRFAEYRALSKKSSRTGDMLVTRPQPMSEYEQWVRDYLSSVVLVDSLAETRALVGFSRIVPATDADQFVRRDLLSAEPRDWLPAYRVKGEGIFLRFHHSKLDEWRKEHGAPQLAKLMARMPAPRPDRLPVTEEAVALHSLSHMLILRLAFEAGYGASSIRERIYSSTDETNRMAGILLYTAAGDADGTLGGLVRLGRPGTLERVLMNALQDAVWCSSDPLCRESPGQGIGSVNLAACHACSLLPETSCEFGNRYLDRLSVVGTGRGERCGLFAATMGG